MVWGVSVLMFRVHVKHFLVGVWRFVLILREAPRFLCVQLLGVGKVEANEQHGNAGISHAVDACASPWAVAHEFNDELNTSPNDLQVELLCDILLWKGSNR